MNKKIITAIGSSCIDEYYDVERMPSIGEKIIGTFKGNIVGGMVGNAAAVMAGYNLEVYIIDFLSNSEESDLLKDDLIKYGIKLDGIDTSNIYSNNKCIILLDKTGERSIIVINGVNDKFKLNKKQIETLEKTDYIYTTLPDLKKFESLDFIYSLIKNNKLKLVFDLEEPGLTSKEDFEILKYASIIFMNEKAKSKIEELITFEKLKEAIPLLVVTLGEKGSVTYLNDNVIVHNPVLVDVVDTTGAGDTYNASYLYGITQDWDYEKCGLFATYAASEKVKRLGPRSGVRDSKEILEIINNIK